MRKAQTQTEGQKTENGKQYVIQYPHRSNGTDRRIFNPVIGVIDRGDHLYCKAQ